MLSRDTPANRTPAERANNNAADADSDELRRIAAAVGEGEAGQAASTARQLCFPLCEAGPAGVAAPTA
jgi:hypothetical protein